MDGRRVVRHQGVELAKTVGDRTPVETGIEPVKSRIPRRFGLDPIRDIQVLCPMNRGGVGARSLNIELQTALNPAGERKVERFGWTFAPGDKVMQIEAEARAPGRPWSNPLALPVVRVDGAVASDAEAPFPARTERSEEWKLLISRVF
jgi:ATP-dependent exoDNAse (exonuclease V) alpha subunit